MEDSENDDVVVLGNGVLRTEHEGMICRLVYVLHDIEMTEAIRQTIQRVLEERRCKEVGMTEEKTIASGTIVRLKSGGPWMTVGERVAGGSELTCDWFDQDSNAFTHAFDPRALLTQDEDEALPGPHFKEFAHSAYKAYGEEAGWKNFRGDPMPAWEDLPENIRKYWAAATVQIISDCNSKYNTSR